MAAPPPSVEGAAAAAAPAPRGALLRAWLRRRPWIWLIVLYVFVLGINIAMAIIALLNQPIEVR